MSSRSSRPLQILLVEGIHSSAQDILASEGFQVRTLVHSPSEDELRELLRGVDAVGIRSKTQLSRVVLEAHKQLLSVGTFCIGTDQVSLSTANCLGIPVFNAPYSNTRSVAELILAEIVCLSRQLGDRNSKAHQGQWLKSSEGAREIRGKTLGIVGYGHIGSQVSVLAEAFGMRVIYYDIVKKLPLGNSQPCARLDEVLASSHFVSLHVPDTPQTRDMISHNELKEMKKGSFLLNASRGTVVDIPALAAALRSGHLAGAAVDVFPMEPASNRESFVSELQGLANVILTPHIGGSTEEAQEAIGVEVAHSLTGFLRCGLTRGAVNFPNVDPPLLHEGCHRLVNVHRNVPGVLGDINTIVSELGVNIQAQSLSTDAQVGYLVMDVEKADCNDLADRIGQLETSIKTRVLV